VPIHGTSWTHTAASNQLAKIGTQPLRPMPTATLRLDRYPLDLIERDFIRGAVVELSRARVLMRGDPADAWFL